MKFRLCKSLIKEKCLALCIRTPYNYPCSIEGHYLPHVEDQKDLGITISEDLKLSKHIQAITRKVSQPIGMIERCFTNRSPTVIRQLYCGLVRSILETNSPVWNPWLKKDIELLDKVQLHCERLYSQSLTLQPLELRRRKADMRETYKFLRGYYKTDAGTLFSLDTRPSRGHSLKLSKELTRTEIRQQFFGNRVVNAWSELHEATVMAPSLDIFKHRLELSDNYT